MGASRSTPGRSRGARPSVAGRPADVPILLDASAIIAAADRDDLNHATAVGWFQRADEPLLLGALTLAEVDVVLQRDIGQAATVALVQSVVDGAIRIVPPTDGDLARAAELMAEAAEHHPRLADACLVAAAERLGVRRVATFDRRPIAVFQPRHVRSFDLEP